MKIQDRLASILKIKLSKSNQSKVNDLKLLGIAVLIGFLAALGALLFRSLIEIFQYAFWGNGSDFLARVQNSPWWLRVTIPVLGGLVAGPIITFFVREARGPGVPEVILAVSRYHSRIRHRVTFLKTAITSFLIGTGASVGREGPIVQIGSSVGSSLAQIFRLRPQMRRICLACGAAAGISATFNAPMAGALFALEIILMNIEVSYITHIVIASLTGSVLSRIFWGEFPAFQVVPFVMGSYWQLLAYLILGISAGICSIGFVRLIYGLDSLFSRLKINDWLKPALGGLGLGLLAIFLPQVMGVGYPTINSALVNSLTLNMALILLAGKAVATALCLGSGMSGGILAPSLYLGASLGTVIGIGASLVWPAQSISPAFFALAGMGAMVSGTTLAPITAILTIFELTMHYQIILPLMAACISSTLLVRLLFGYSVYEMKLLRKGSQIVRGHDVGILRNLLVGDFMGNEYPYIFEQTDLEIALDKILKHPFPHFIVFDEQNRLAGVISMQDLRSSLLVKEEERTGYKAADVMSKKVTTLNEIDNLEDAFHLFENKGFAMIPVVDQYDKYRVKGIITKDSLLQVYDEQVLKDRLLSGPVA